MLPADMCVHVARCLIRIEILMPTCMKDSSRACCVAKPSSMLLKSTIGNLECEVIKGHAVPQADLASIQTWALAKQH